MLLFLSIFGIFLSVIILIFNLKRNLSARYLGAFFFLVSLYAFYQYVLLYSKSSFLIGIFIGYFAFPLYLTGPFLYWYVRSLLTDNSRFKKRDLWHLLPALIHFIFSLPYILTPWSYKVEIASEIVNDVSFIEDFKFTFLSEVFSVHALYLSRPVLVLGYMFWCALLFFRYLLLKKKSFVFARQRFMASWLSFLLGFLFILNVSHILLMLKTVSDFISLNILQIISAFGLVGLLVSPFFYPSILYGLPQVPMPDFQTGSGTGEADQPSVAFNKKTPNFENDYLISISEKIETCINAFQPYLQPGFNLAQLSVLIQIPVHHLTYYFREYKKQRFSEFRNSLRIDHAKRLMTEGKAVGITLEAIGMLSGFSTRNTFFTAFKKAEGISPGEFADKFAE